MSDPLVFSFEMLGSDQVKGPSRTSEVGSKWQVPDSQDFAVLLSPSGHFASHGKLLSEESVHFKDMGNGGNALSATGVEIKFNYLLRTTPEFRALSPERRNCHFPNEKKLDFFPEYSEANCVLECAWKQAVEECKCAPWFLMGHFARSYMCEAWGNRCFKAVVDERYSKDSFGCPEQCPNNCEFEEFEISKMGVGTLSASVQSFMCTALQDDPACPQVVMRQNNTEQIIGNSRTL